MINVEESSRELIVINVRPTQDDPMYMGCLWMTVYVDTAAWRLMVDSDCGSYIYHWPNEDEIHPFRKALAGYLMDEDYILGKISKRTEFDKESTLQSVLDSYSDDPETLEVIRETTDNVTNAQEFYDACESLDALDCCLYECLCYDYPYQAKRVAHLLKEYVAPVLRGKERMAMRFNGDLISRKALLNEFNSFIKIDRKSINSIKLSKVVSRIEIAPTAEAEPVQSERIAKLEAKLVEVTRERDALAAKNRSLRCDRDLAEERYAELAEVKQKLEAKLAELEAMQERGDLALVRHGHWVEDEDGQHCSECGEEHNWGEYRASYCDTCGAIMDTKGATNDE